jgi:hypothetical protein
LNDYNLQGYLQNFRTYDFENRGTYNINNRLYIGRAGLGPIATRFEKLIICFETGTVYITREKKEDLQDVLHYSFLI